MDSTNFYNKFESIIKKLHSKELYKKWTLLIFMINSNQFIGIKFTILS